MPSSRELVVCMHNGVSLLDAAVDGRTHDVKWLLAAKANVHAIDEIGATPLHWVADNGQTATASQLLVAKASVNATTMYGRTPLHCAASRGYTAVAWQLLKANSNVELKVAI